jgi:hypothetical protein
MMAQEKRLANASSASTVNATAPLERSICSSSLPPDAGAGIGTPWSSLWKSRKIVRRIVWAVICGS